MFPCAVHFAFGALHDLWPAHVDRLRSGVRVDVALRVDHRELAPSFGQSAREIGIAFPDRLHDLFRSEALLEQLERPRP